MSNQVITTTEEFWELAEFPYDVPSAKAIRPHDGCDYASDLLSAVQNFYNIKLDGQAFIDFLDHAPAVFEEAYGRKLNN